MDVVYLLIEQIDKRLLMIPVLMVLALILIIRYLYHEQLTANLTHPRNRVMSLTDGVLWVVFLGCGALDFLPDWCWISAGTVAVLFTVFSVYLWKHALPPAGRLLKRYNSYLQDGALYEFPELKEIKIPWYIFRKADRNSIYLLKVKYFLRIHEPEKMLMCLEKIDESILLDREKYSYYIDQAFAYTDMLAVDKAEIWLERAEQWLSKHKNTRVGYNMYCNLRTLIYDQQGDMEKAEEYAQEGLKHTEPGDYFMSCQLLNNLSRYRVLDGDSENAMLYLRQAREQLLKEKHPDTEVLFTIYGNLIHHLLRMDVGVEEAGALLEELKRKVDLNWLGNQIEYNNLVLEMNRQIGNIEYESIACQMYQKNKALIEAQAQGKVTAELVLNEVSALTILVNGTFSLEPVLEDIRAHFGKYKELPVREKIFAYQKLHSCCALMKPCWHEEFQEIYDDILKYYRRDALTDIDRVQARLNPHNVSGKLDILQAKAYILKVLYGTGCYTYVRPVHEAAVKLSAQAHLYKIYAREYMLWLDELTGPEVWPPYLSKPPLLMDNLEILEEARQAYERVKNSPDMYEFAILLSCQYLILGDKELSRKYLEEFMSHNVKIYFYAAWLRLKYYYLLQCHGMFHLIDQVDYQHVLEQGKGAMYGKRRNEAP